MSKLQKILFYFSWLVLLVALCHRLLPLSHPACPVLNYLMPVLLTGAIGFLTNYLAIEMLFKPYSAESTSFRRLFHAGFWKDGGVLRIITLGFWKIGLVSANKDQIGQKLGEEIPRRLLDEGELSRHILEELSRLPEQDPDFAGRIRSILTSITIDSPEFLKQAGDFLEKQILPAVTEQLLTPAMLREQLTDFSEQWFADEQNRRKLAGLIIRTADENIIPLREIIRESIQTTARDIMQKQSPMIAMFGGSMLDNMLNSYDWSRLDDILRNKLNTEEFQNRLAELSKELPGRFTDWSSSEDGIRQSEIWCGELSRRIRNAVSGQSAGLLQTLGRGLLESRESAEWIRRNLLPALRTELQNWYNGGGRELLIRILNLPARIENAVARQDIREFHQMVNTLADRHLCAIQVLGFFIGMAIGLIQLI